MAQQTQTTRSKSGQPTPGRRGKKTDRTQATRTVAITVEKGRIVVQPDPVVAYRGDRIEWCFDDGAWGVSFPGISPFAGGNDYRPGDVGAGAGKAAGASVAAAAPFGRYKYIVAVATDKGVLIEDPEVETRPKS